MYREDNERERLWKDMEITVMWKLINCTSNKIEPDYQTYRQTYVQSERRTQTFKKVGLALNKYISDALFKVNYSLGKPCKGIYLYMMNY